MAIKNWLAPLGAVGGALLGSFLPGVGTGLGAMLGGGLGGAAAASLPDRNASPSCKNGRCGHKAHAGDQSANGLGIVQQPLLTPQQQELQNATIRQSLGLLNGQNAPGFGPIAENARKQFQTITLPSLAERFTTLGAGLQDPAFKAAGLQAGSDLESQLGLLQGQYNQAMLGALLPYGLRQTTENILPQQEQSRSPLGADFLSQGTSDLAQLLGTYYQESQAKKAMPDSTNDMNKNNRSNVQPYLSPEALLRNQLPLGNRLGGNPQQFSNALSSGYGVR